MNKTLNDFIGNVKDGMANNSHYDVVISKPRVVTSNLFDNNAIEKVMLFCDQTQLPGLNISTTPIRTYGEAREMPYDKLFDPVNLSFYIDKEMKIKMFFDEWIQNIQNPFSRTFTYYRDYVTDIEIITYDMSNFPRYRVKLFEAYPKTLNAIQMDYNNKDVMKMSVTMQYKYWRSDPIAASGTNQYNAQLPEELRGISSSGVPVPSIYFDNQAEFQKNAAQAMAMTTNFSQWWSTLNA